MTPEPDPAGAPSWHAEREMFPRLVRNFLRQLFENDLLPEDVDIRQSVAWLAALFAAPAAILSVLLVLKYAAVVYQIEQVPDRFTELERATWGDELFFILYSMTAVGFLTVLIWESAFPDARDAQVLGVLPVRARTVVVAKLAGLLLFVGVFAFAINVPTAAGFALAVMGLSRLAGPAYLLVHMVVAPLAGLFVFVCLVVLQTTLTTLLPHRVLRGITVATQLLFVIALIEMLVYSPAISTWLAAQALVLADTGAGSWLPPLWFLGLYETLLGSDLASFHRLAGTAVAATSLMLASGAAIYALGYGRITRRAIEGVQPAPSPPGVLSRLVSKVSGRLAPGRTGRAVTVFVCASLARSRRHRLLFALYLGVALALILSGFVGSASDGATLAAGQPTVLLLSIPLVFSFFALIGLRVLFAVPIELSANWVFQMTELDDKTGYLQGTRNALIVIGLVPLALVTLPAYWVLWGPAAAIGHTLLWVLLGLLLVEALLTAFSKVPFTCSYVPGRANVRMLAPLYVALTLMYGYSTARWELWLLAEPRRWLVTAIALLVALAVTRHRRRTRQVEVPFLTYQETDPDARVELGLRHARPRAGDEAPTPPPATGERSATHEWGGLHLRPRDHALAGSWWPRRFRRDRQIDEPDAELRDYIAAQAAEYRRQGMTPDDAHRLASATGSRLELVKEFWSDVRGTQWIDELWQDLRYGVRSLRRHRWVSLAAVCAVGLSIGANGTAYTLVRGLLFSDLPVERPEEIMAIGTGVWVSPRPAPGVSQPDFEDWRRQNRTFSDLALIRMATFNVGDNEGAPEQVSGAYLSTHTFALLNIRPVVGRGFADRDNLPGAPPVALLGFDVWQARYGGDPEVRGRTIRTNGVPATVIGVMPCGMHFPYTQNLWLPTSQMPGPPLGRDVRPFLVVGRLADGVTQAQARADMTVVAAGLAQAYPDSNGDISATVTPWTVQTNFGGIISNVVVLLMIAVACVLLIACAIVSTLLLAKAVHRTHEVSTRLSLGATRGRILRQMLAECLILAVAGGAVGVAFSVAGTRWFVAGLDTFGTFPYWMRFELDSGVVLFVAALCVVTPLLFGLPPAWHLARTNALDVVQSGGRSRTGSRDARRSMSTLSVAVVALTVVLLAGTWALLSSVVLQPDLDVGFEPSSLYTTRFTMPQQAYATPEDRLQFLRRLDAALERRPGAELATTTSNAPLRSGTERRLDIDGRPSPSGDDGPPVTMLSVGPRYFETLGAALRQGNTLPVDGPMRGSSAVINQRFADLYFADSSPLGARIRLGDPQGRTPDSNWLTVVGVTPTVPQRMTGTPSDPVVYVGHEANPTLSGRAEILVRTDADLGGSVAALRELVRGLDPDLPLFDVTTMDAQVSKNDGFTRLVLIPFLGLGGTALVLVVIGLYAMTAYGVSRRTKEVGIRRALGAQATQVWWLLVRHSLTLVALGLALGLAGGVGLTRFLANRVPGAGSDLMLLGPAVVVLLAVALIACLVPTHRATRLPPVAALRHD